MRTDGLRVHGSECRGRIVSRNMNIGCWLVFMMLVSPLRAAGDTQLVGPFSSASAGADFPRPWTPLEFDGIARHSEYRLIRDGDAVVVRADSRAAASGLTRKVAIDLRDYPILEWRWQVANVLASADIARKSGDDFPARIYVGFAYDPQRVRWWERAKFALIKLFYGRYPPIAAINYVWASHAPVGTAIPNVYTKRVFMYVLRSGAQDVGSWRVERRDVYADYRRAFGREPPPVSDIAIMTDTDNTGEAATAFYGDIAFRRRGSAPAPLPAAP